MSRESAKSFWGNEFDQSRIHPGDTIVVPEKTYRGNGLRSLLDFAQLFSSIALGAGALAVITNSSDHGNRTGQRGYSGCGLELRSPTDPEGRNGTGEGTQAGRAGRAAHLCAAQVADRWAGRWPDW